MGPNQPKAAPLDLLEDIAIRSAELGSLPGDADPVALAEPEDSEVLDIGVPGDRAVPAGDLLSAPPGVGSHGQDGVALGGAALAVLFGRRLCVRRRCLEARSAAQGTLNERFNASSHI